VSPFTDFVALRWIRSRHYIFDTPGSSYMYVSPVSSVIELGNIVN